MASAIRVRALVKRFDDVVAVDGIDLDSVREDDRASEPRDVAQGSPREIAAGDPRIEFAGAFDHDRLAPVLSGLQALVVPSLWRENTPFVCLEARAAGIELVVSDLAGMTECVPEGRGVAFVPGDAAALRARLAEIAARVRARKFRRLPVDDAIPDVATQFADFRSRYAALAR